MSAAEINGDEPAFARASGPEPRINVATDYSDGLTKRELFAAMAMQGMCANPHENVAALPKHVAEDAVKYADALLDALAEPWS